MTRIVAGRAGGLRLAVPRGDTTRPTSERVREALFSALESRGAVAGTNVLDLYAGSGALGLEAVSRGAASATLVDSARGAVDAARRNAAALRLPRITVVLSSVERYLLQPVTQPAGLVFLDPPYATPEDQVAGALRALVTGRRVRPGGLVVVERSARSGEPIWPAGLARIGVRRYGETAVFTALHQPAPDVEPDA